MINSLTRIERLRVGRWLSLFNLIHPPLCAGCRRVGHLLCVNCIEQLTAVEYAFCSRCNDWLPPAESGCSSCNTPDAIAVTAVAAFDPPLRPAIHAFKYHGQFRLALPLAELMRAEWRAQGVDIVVPIPLYAERRRQRGYNQAQLLAEHFADQLGLAVLSKALFRTRATQPQVGLSRRLRRENVAGAFAADGRQLAKRHVLLIDDVCTTGATLSAAAEALAAAGCASVRAYCLARAREGDGDLTTPLV